MPVARDDREVYYFDIVGAREAGFAPFRHDYKPRFERIKAAFAQDLPERIKPINPRVLTRTVDPYLPIATLRRQFEGKGRQLGGFMFLIRGLYSKRANGKGRVNATEKTPWRDLDLGCPRWGHWASSGGSPAGGIHEVHPMAMLHLNMYVGVYERRSWYWETIFDFDRKIEAATGKGREELIDRKHQFMNMLDIQTGQPKRKGVKRYFRDFPLPEQRRQVTGPPDVIVVPEGGELDWSDMERAAKRLLEAEMEHGCYAITDFDVYAIDMRGCYTHATSTGVVDTLFLAMVANHVYHASFFWSMEIAIDWISKQDGCDYGEARNKLHQVMRDRYRFGYDVYMTAERSPGWWESGWLPEDYPQRVQEMRELQEEGIRNGTMRTAEDVRVW